MLKKRSKIAAPVFRATSQGIRTINGESVQVFAEDASGKIVVGWGAVTIANLNGQTDFAKSAMIIKTDAADGVAGMYENVGTAAASSFNLVGAVTPGEITLAEGNMLIGNAGGVAAALNVKTTGQIPVGNGTTVTSVPISGGAKLLSTGELNTGIYGVNHTGAPLTAGMLVVPVVDNGTGDVSLELAGAGSATTGSGNVPASHVISETIANGATGFAYDSEVITGLNTAGRAVGDNVYLSGTSGAFTFTEPTAGPQTSQIVGFVKTVDAVTGTIHFVPGYRLDIGLPASRIQDGTGTSALIVKKQALVVYDFAVHGGAQGNIALGTDVQIPDNCVVKAVSYDVLTTFTSATDAATVALGLVTDGALNAAVAISDASNPLDAGVFAAGATTNNGLLASWDAVKTTGNRAFVLTVAGGENLTAGKAIFQVEYWQSI